MCVNFCDIPCIPFTLNNNFLCLSKHEDHRATTNAICWKLTGDTTYYHQGLEVSLTRFEVILVRLSGRKHMKEYNMSFPIACRWHYDIDWIWACRCLQACTVISHVKFGEYLTMFNQVTTTFSFMAKHTKWLPCHGHKLQQKQKLLKTFHYKGLRIQLHSNLSQTDQLCRRSSFKYST